MSLRSTTALVSLGLLIGSTAAIATSAYETLTIRTLPEEGRVSLSGIIDDLDGRNEFSLRDSKGDTIRVESDRDLDLRKGDHVKVIGMLDRGFLNIGKEIDAINITVLNRAEQLKDSEPKIEYRTSVYYWSDDNVDWKGKEYGTIDKLPKAGAVAMSATVESVHADNHVVIVKDETGDTIDVHTIRHPDVTKGDKVTVQGRMVDEWAGMGREIVSASVIK